MTTRIAYMGTGLAVVSVLLLAGTGCGGSNTTAAQDGAQQRTRQQAQRQAAKRRVVLRHRAKTRARHAVARARVRKAHRAEIREIHAEEAEARQQAIAEEVASEEESECDPNYSGACLNPNSSDYDCEGGSGNGPDYTGTVTVVGEDHYGLDADGDGIGCEPA